MRNLLLGDDDEVVSSLVDFEEVDNAGMWLGQLQHVHLMQGFVSTVAASTTLV